MQTPAEKHEWVAQYNWDDGVDPIWPIVDDEKTDFGTALLIYWRLDGPWLAGSSSVDTKRLHDALLSRLTSGFYINRQIRYYPVEDNQLSKTQVLKLRMSGLAIDLLVPHYAEPGH